MQDQWNARINSYGETEVYWSEKPSAIVSLAASLAAWCDRHMTAETADQIETFFNKEAQ